LEYEKHSQRVHLVITVCYLYLLVIFFSLWYTALVVVYAYYSNAQTLYDAHIKPKAPAYQQPIYYGHHQQLHKYQQAQHQILPERMSHVVVVYCTACICYQEGTRERSGGEDVGCNKNLSYRPGSVRHFAFVKALLIDLIHLSI
jgi:hypothetical protein